MTHATWKQAPLATLTLAALLATGVTGCKKTPPVDDAALTAQVQQKLAADSGLANESVQVTTANGVVILAGSVSNAAARSLAANDAASITGVQKVVNSLTVTDTVPPVTSATAPLPVQPAPSTRQTEKRRRQEASSARDAGAPVERSSPPPSQLPSQVAQQAPPPPAQPVARTITVPSGSTLPVRVTQTLDSATTQIGDSFTGAVATDIVQDGMLLIPRGATVSGRVTEVHEAAHFKGSALLTVELTSVTLHGDRVPLSTQPYSVEGKGRGQNTAVKTGVGAAAGAILGGIFGGGKGAAIGAAAGGGTGAGINAITRGEQVQIPSESVVRFTLLNSVAVRTSTSAGGSSSGLYNR